MRRTTERAPSRTVSNGMVETSRRRHRAMGLRGFRVAVQKQIAKPVTRDRLDAGRVSKKSLRDGRSDRSFGARALATAARCFRRLLAALDRRLHVVPAALELAKNTFGGHLALEI